MKSSTSEDHSSPEKCMHNDDVKPAKPIKKTIQDLQKDIREIKNFLNIIKKVAATQTMQKM